MGRHTSKPARKPVSAAITGALVTGAGLLVCLALFAQEQSEPPTPVAVPAITTTTTTKPPVIATTTKPKPPVVTTTTTTAPPVATTTTTKEPEPTTEPPATTTTAAPEPEPKPEPVVAPSRCENLGGAKRIVVDACTDILNAVEVPGSVGGVGRRPGNPTSCHPKGLGLDLGTGGSRKHGDRIAEYARENADRLGINLVLWRVPAHYDHVHLSFSPCNG